MYLLFVLFILFSQVLGDSPSLLLSVYDQSMHLNFVGFYHLHIVTFIKYFGLRIIKIISVMSLLPTCSLYVAVTPIIYGNMSNV